MHINRLKDVTIHTLKEGMHCDGGGLWLQITTGTDGRLNHSWLFRYKSRATGKQRSKGLGALHTVGLAKARDKARVCRNQLLDGIDPVDQKKAERNALKLEAAKFITFDEATEQYIAGKERGWDKKTHGGWVRTMKKYCSPIIGKYHVKDIENVLVLKVLKQPMKDSTFWLTKTSTADDVRGRMETVLNWAAANGYRPEGKNPASWDIVTHSLPAPSTIHEVKPRHALPHVHMSAFMSELRKIETIQALALQFAILTGVRTDEVLGARWDEINLLDMRVDTDTAKPKEARTWNILKDRMKGEKGQKKQHVVPLSHAALVVLERAQELGRSRQSELVFPNLNTGTKLPPYAMRDVCKFLVVRELKRKAILRDDVKVDVHGFRSSYIDWGRATGKYPDHVVFKAIAHDNLVKSDKAYVRDDALLELRRPVMEDWGQYCSAV